MTNVENNSKNYLIKSISKNFSSDLFTLFGTESRAESGLLVLNDANKKPSKVLGFQTRRYNKDLNFKREEFMGLSSRLAANLPSTILNSIKFPQWEGNGGVKNLTIEHILFFNVPVLETISSITEESVKRELTYVVNHWGKLGSLPMSADNNPYGGEDEGMKDFRAGRYEAAYKNWELVTIPQLVMRVLNASASVEERMGAFEQLQNIPLFHEIGASVMLRLIPTELLEKAVNYRLSISGNDSSKIGGERSDFPADPRKQEYLNVVAAAISETTYLSDRSFNVKMFINEQGKSIGLDQLIQEAK